MIAGSSLLLPDGPRVYVWPDLPSPNGLRSANPYHGATTSFTGEKR